MIQCSGHRAGNFKSVQNEENKIKKKQVKKTINAKAKSLSDSGMYQNSLKCEDSCSK